MNKNFDLAIVAGFGDKGIDKLARKLSAELLPRTTNVISSAPWHRALQHPESIISQVTEDITALNSDNLLLVGHSYGALIALAYASRTKLANVLKAVLIDGPLNPDIDVTPAKTAHNIFYRHYEYREQLARRCEQELSQIDTSKIICVGALNDRIVPPGAKHLNGNFDNIHLGAYSDTEQTSFSSIKGLNIFLPELYKGHRLEHKIGIISKLIQRAMLRV